MLTKVKTRRDAESTNVNAESIKTRYTPHRNSDRDIYIFLPGEISSRRRGLSEQSPCIVEMICWVVVDFSAVKLRFGLKQKAQDGLPSYLNPPSVRPPHHLIQSHNNHLEGGGGGGTLTSLIHTMPRCTRVQHTAQSLHNIQQASQYLSLAIPFLQM